MRKSRRERGEGNAGCLVGLIILAIAIFIAYKMIPPKIKAADLKQTITDEAKMAGSHNNDVIMKSILAKARDQKLPVTEDNVKITRDRSEITVEVDYDVPIDFPGKTWMWHQHILAQNPIGQRSVRRRRRLHPDGCARQSDRGRQEGALPLRRLDDEAVLRRHALEDRLPGRDRRGSGVGAEAAVVTWLVLELEDHSLPSGEIEAALAARVGFLVDDEWLVHGPFPRSRRGPQA